MKRRMLCLVMAAALVCALVPTAAQAKGSPYYIRVNCSTCTVTIYETDGAGRRAEPLKAMVCSVGKPGRGLTPTGTYTLTGYRPLWCHMKDGSYGQYISQFKGNYLFHSVCYQRRDPSTLIASEYNDLGSPASLGCVRLQTADAKWIYENCPAGTKVEIFNGQASDDPLGTPAKAVERLEPDDPNSGWDPTDPREENPWHAILAAPGLTAYASTQTVQVDGRAVTFYAYALKDERGNDTNYIKLRDVALALNDTAAQFEVGWDGATAAVATKTAYTPNGSEMVQSFQGDRRCTAGAVCVVIDGKPTDLQAITLTDEAGGGYTYFKLRDLGAALGFHVTWNAGTGIAVDSELPGGVLTETAVDAEAPEEGES